jgi:superfamily II DNA helicase RecQ
VDYLDSTGGPISAGSQGGHTGRGKVDYREKLSPADFAVFARLREVRKRIAQEDGVPIYTVFTNEQLAQMVAARATTKAALEQVAGVGDARIEKYGARVLEVLQRQYDGAGIDAPIGSSV